MNVIPSSTTYRTIWISDVHLGTRGCKAEMLLEFLRCSESESLYLVGDILDGWRLKTSWYWHQTHNDVIQKLLRKARKGTRVVYVPGNHDAMMRDYIDLDFGGIAIRREAVHETADGKRLLVIHGDEFDAIVRYATPLAVLGDRAYNFMLAVNHWYNVARQRLGYPYWSLSAYLKQRVKDAVGYIGRFEALVADEAQRRGLDGVVCGHIHKAEIRRIGDILYGNSGDWVESCTALVERFDGTLEIIAWPQQQRLAARPPERASVAAR
jgi:UDP-2,3-diacylglucosamine pyrophosphatase LpxH